MLLTDLLTGFIWYSEFESKTFPTSVNIINLIIRDIATITAATVFTAPVNKQQNRLCTIPRLQPIALNYTSAYSNMGYQKHEI